MPTSEDRISALKTAAGKFLAYSFVLIFLFSQTSSLLHSHAGDLKRHVDCELCLKVGSGDDTLIATHTLASFSESTTRFLSLPVLATSFQVVVAKSRSPPAYV